MAAGRDHADPDSGGLTCRQVGCGKPATHRGGWQVDDQEGVYCDSCKDYCDWAVPLEPTLGLPYKPKTRQEQGGVTEKKVLRERGARQHPRSGAGRIKEDGSDAAHLYEVKDANKTFALTGEALLQSWQRAVQQGRDAVWVVQFANGIEAEIHLTRRNPRV